jgi:hypothetical protein
MPFAQPRMMQMPAPVPQNIPAPPPPNPQWAAVNPNRPALPKPIIRAQSEDPPAPPSHTSLRLPSPEQLGIPAVKIAAEEKTFDQRLQSLGATGLKVESIGGGFRAHFVLPGERPIEAEGPNRDAALNLALDRAELSVRP